MHSFFIYFRKEIFIACTGIIFWGCGLFIPGEPEFPNTNTNKSDIFNFKEILNNTNAQFNFQDYEDLFSPSFNYVDAAMGLDTFHRSDIIGRLTSIKNRVKKVRWYPIDTSSIEFLDKTKSLATLRPRKYTVYTSVNPDTIYQGEAVFDVQFSNAQEWIIIHWKDRNGSGTNEKSYFNPQF